MQQGYDALFETHKKWWAEYNGKSSVTVPDVYTQNRYNMGNYLLGAASRRGCYPMPLQGLWTACDDKFLPPWKGDYHHDLNTEMTYYSYLKANRLEQGLSFLDYLSSLTERGRAFAKGFYNAEGICLPSVMDIDGYAMGGWAMYSLSPTNQIWLCQGFERYYTYTCDIEFLKKRHIRLWNSPQGVFFRFCKRTVTDIMYCRFRVLPKFTIVQKSVFNAQSQL